jgi:hypothetical protein
VTGFTPHDVYGNDEDARERKLQNIHSLQVPASSTFANILADKESYIGKLRVMGQVSHGGGWCWGAWNNTHCKVIWQRNECKEGK